MHVDTLTSDHVVIVQAAAAHRGDQPDYARTLLSTIDEPLTRALELVGLLMVERAETLEAGR